MRRPVNIVVEQIADGEEREDRLGSGWSEEHAEDREEDHGPEAGGDRWQHQPGGLLRIIVMESVDHELEARAERPRRTHVEEIPVEEVLR